MKETGQFYKPPEIRNFYEEVVPVYQSAFAGEPWFEVSKCVDSSTIQRCAGGFSPLPIGAVCELCGSCPSRPAYEKDELIGKFELIARTRPTAWYMEKGNLGATLFALAWIKEPFSIAKERYPDVPEMKSWMVDKLGTTPLMWLDEVFADKTKKPKGNLRNFSDMCRGLARRLQMDTIAYRTITPQMVAAPVRDFGEQVTVYKRQLEVPDRRDFVVIDLGGNK
jgi:hypothetical protein